MEVMTCFRSIFKSGFLNVHINEDLIGSTAFEDGNKKKRKEGYKNMFRDFQFGQGPFVEVS